jgi:hypothetical protein
MLRILIGSRMRYLGDRSIALRRAIEVKTVSTDITRIEARIFRLGNNPGRHWNTDSDLRIKLHSLLIKFNADLMECVVMAAMKD